MCHAAATVRICLYVLLKSRGFAFSAATDVDSLPVATQMLHDDLLYFFQPHHGGILMRHMILANLQHFDPAFYRYQFCFIQDEPISLASNLSAEFCDE